MPQPLYCFCVNLSLQGCFKQKTNRQRNQCVTCHAHHNLEIYISSHACTLPLCFTPAKRRTAGAAHHSSGKEPMQILCQAAAVRAVACLQGLEQTRGAGGPASKQPCKSIPDAMAGRTHTVLLQYASAISMQFITPQQFQPSC